MLVLLLLVISIGVIDSLNPSTLAPALLLAVGTHGRKDLVAFTLGVFGVSTLGGLALVLGPGRALLAVVSKPGQHTIHLIELVTGVAVVAVAVVLWLARAWVARGLRYEERQAGRSAFLLGAAIMGAELPTAFPYFGALAAVVEAHRALPTEILLVLFYNVCFVAPLLLLLFAVVVGGARGARIADVARRNLQRHGPVIVPAALAVLGVAIFVLGATGL